MIMSLCDCLMGVSRIKSVAGLRQIRLQRTFELTVVLFVFLAIPAVLPPDLPAQSIRQASDSGPAIEEPLVADLDGAGTSFRLRDLDLHPDFLYQPYTTGRLLGDAVSTPSESIAAFRELLDLYIQRQSVDDNFTIRVVDNRKNEVLELFVLEDERERYERTGRGNWEEVDKKRRVEMRRLIDKYAARGIPRGAITVRWGHANEVREARERELPFIEYELRLARFLGLSLLSTEIGTVETFNMDERVSSAGARGRYQMMPYLLRKNGILHYQLRTAGGQPVNVREEWHPLLTMEPAFLTLKGYINAAGHEIPGISAYHAGPGNIFKIYRQFLEKPRSLVQPASTVVDAYVWAVTDGYPEVSSGSSFGQYSRAYVASVYGSLRATEDESIDTSATMLTERVQLLPGKQIQLSRLLRTLDEHRDRLTWSKTSPDLSAYELFRELNPHIALPSSDGEGIPARGDIRLVSTVGNSKVRFFLPLGATRVLEDAGVDVLNRFATFRFDHTTYAPAGSPEVTEWDREYDDLVSDIEHFGFTTRNRQQLIRLKDKFKELANENPSHYRMAQLDIIETHERIWTSKPFDTLAQTAARNAGKLGR